MSATNSVRVFSRRPTSSATSSEASAAITSPAHANQRPVVDSGAYSCARCHTEGWSYQSPGVPGQGAFGWNLTGGSTNSHFPSEQDMINFVKSGSEIGARYGKQSQGTGRMPGFGSLLTDEQIKAIVEYVRSL